ncbi:MAG: hypothetical protein FJX78_00455 [Armatimonadetes bacterium]|nr:hypothetical protein [Armatimonadota bacterium]
MKASYQGKQDVRPHADFINGALFFATNAEQEHGSYYSAMASLIFSAFELEAYVNFLGSKRFKSWSLLERLREEDKFQLLSEDLSIVPRWGSRPYQTLKWLRKFRNDIAHGKPEVIIVQELVSSGSEPLAHLPKADWQLRCTKNTQMSL